MLKSTKHKKHSYITIINLQLMSLKILLNNIILFTLIMLAPMSKIIAKEVNSEKNIIKNHILVLDNSISSNIPKRYRDGTKLTPKLYASASAQPNLKDFKYIIQHAKQQLNTNSNSKIFIVDLRQEPHAMLDGQAISWYGLKNQLPNYYEKNLINKLKKSKIIKVYKGINKLPEGKFIPKGHLLLPNKNLINEKELITNLGTNYLRILVNDHFAPNDNEINVFVNFIKSLPKNSWVHFHCRGGRGRSTSFMVMLDIIRHAPKLTLNEILERQQQLGGVNLSKTHFTIIRKKWKENPAKERYDFIKNFYEYIVDPNGYKKSSWSDWGFKKSL